MSTEVLRIRDLDAKAIAAVLARFGLEWVLLPEDASIPGSYWGAEEAGLIGRQILVRPDTPLHSVLHEACHWITCTPARRASVHTDAADTEEEEVATCYLQILLADAVPGFGRARALADMDAWGYSFRLGSAARWFAEDAEDARAFLLREGLIDAQDALQWRVRGG